MPVLVDFGVVVAIDVALALTCVVDVMRCFSESRIASRRQTPAVVRPKADHVSSPPPTPADDARRASIGPERSGTAGVSATLCIPLDEDHVDAVRTLRVRLGGSEDEPPPIVHLSLLVVLDGPDESMLTQVAEDTAKRMEAFTVRARDLGVFLDGEASPVLHVPVVRSSALARLHQTAFDSLADLGFVIEGRSHPDRWLPHITVWRGTLTPELLGDALVRYASGPPVSWTVPAQRLAWLNDAGLTSERTLGGSRCHS